MMYTLQTQKVICTKVLCGDIKGESFSESEILQISKHDIKFLKVAKPFHHVNYP